MTTERKQKLNTKEEVLNTTFMEIYLAVRQKEVHNYVLEGATYTEHKDISVYG